MLPHQRYALAQLSDGVALRLDTHTGETEVCVMSRDYDLGKGTKYTASCDGRRAQATINGE